MRLPSTDGIIGRCTDCDRLMGTHARWKELGLIRHEGGGLCRTCNRRKLRRREGVAPKSAVYVAKPRPEWMLRAPCREVDPNLFYPEGKGDNKKTDEARAICGGCRYTAPCLTWALERKEEGLWGGWTERERRGKTLADFFEDAA